VARRDSEKALAPADLARARADLAAARGRRRLDVLIDARDPEALVRALPPDEVYFTVRDIGLGDAVQLVQLASPEQFRSFLDLEAWTGDRFDPRRALPWLRAARAGALSSPLAEERWAQKLAALDPELLFLVLRGTLRVIDLDEDPDPEIATDRFLRTPEGKFVVEFHVDGPEYAAVRGIVDDLYAQDPFQATRLLSSLRWETDSELEESALRWRAARLEDLGIPRLEEALSWFTRPPPGAALPAGAPERPGGFFLAQFRRGSLLDRAAALLDEPARDAVEAGVLAAANAALVADGIDPGDLDGVRDAIGAARAMIELGLEKAAGGDEAAAARALSGTPVKRIFQEGFGRVLELKWRAERIFREGGAGTREAPLLDPPLGEALSALAARRPRYFPGLEAPRAEWGTPAAGAAEPRSFASAGEIARTSAALDLAQALAALGRALGLPPARADRPVPLTLSALYLTARANEALGRAFAPEPIPAAELPAALAALPSLPDDARLSGAGDAGALLLELGRRRLEELRATPAGARPDAVTAMWLV
jgi:hypothetical protein